MEKLALKKASLFWIVAALFFFPLGIAASQETAEAPQAAPSELDALKAEWEEVREQQIQMIREKEEQLEQLKEELFQKLKAANEGKTAPGPVPVAVDQTQVEALLLQNKEEALTRREQALADREAEWARRTASAAGPASAVSESASGEISKERRELEAQKTAFQEERQKFFQEMNRQKEKLRELQSSLDREAKKIQEDRARPEQGQPAAS